MKKILCLTILAVVLTGCQGVRTHNYTASKSLYYIASQEKECLDITQKNALIVFVTENKNPVIFTFWNKNNSNSKASGKIDNNAFAAFVIEPGEYVFQKNLIFTAKPNEIIIFQSSEKETKKISNEEFKEKYRHKDLTQECSGTEIIVPAHLKVPDLVGGAERFGYYTGKTIGGIIVSPFYILYGTCFVIGCGAKGAMASGSPGAMIGGALVYALTFWAVPSDVAESIAADEVPFSNDPVQGENNTSPSAVKENALGPGIHQDQYGRPVRYSVPNGVPGEMLQVKPDAYGPGTGMDQYGRPVKTVPAF